MYIVISVSVRRDLKIVCVFLLSPQCEMCDLRFRHKSQLRLHLRQKHGAMPNIKTFNHWNILI